MDTKKTEAARMLGRLGGKARANKLSEEEMKAIARLGGLAKARKRKLQKALDAKQRAK